MRTIRILSGCLTLSLMMALALPVSAATAPEQLNQAAELFQQGQYEQAQKILLEIDREQLSAEQKQHRDELVEEIGIAINQSTKARQDLEDADKAFDSNDREDAEKLFRAVQNNAYATPAQKQRARQGVALIAKQRELEQKLSAPAAATQPEAAAAPAPPPGPSTQPAMDAAAPRTERDRAEAMRLIQAGDEAIAKGQYDLAEQRFQEAMRLVPNHPAAVQGLELVRQHRAVVGQPNIIEQETLRRRARWDRTERLYRQNEVAIRSLINDKQFAEARQLLATTRQLLEAARRDAQPPERFAALSTALDSLDRYIEAEERETSEREAAEQRRTAIQRERERRELDQKDRDERVAQLFEQAMILRKERQFNKAADVLREIIAIDPTYERAKWLLESLEDAHLIQKQKANRQKFLDQVQDAMLEAERARTPEVVGMDEEILAYPSEDEWRIIAQRDPFGAGLTGEKEEDRVARQQMSTVIPEVVFPDGTTFEEVIEFLRGVGKVSIDVNWNELEGAGIDRTTPLSMNLHNVKLETAIELLLDNVAGAGGIELGFNVIDGIIRISTLDELNRKTFPRVYDVQDLLIQIRSFEAPQNSLGGGGGSQFGGGGLGGGGLGGGGFGGGGLGGGGFGGGGGGFGGGGGGFGGGGGGFGGGGGGGGGGGEGDDDSSEEERQELVEDLEEMIKGMIEPDTWEPEGTTGSLQIWNDRLIVRHTASVHRQLVDLFRQLRQTKDIQVAIEARFITMTSNFLEEIGVDLDIILNNGNAGLDNALTGAGRARDPVTGAQLLQPRQFTSLGFTPATPGLGVPLPQTGLLQPYQNVALVPQGNPGNWFSQHTTPIPILNNTIDMAAPRATIVPGSLEGFNTTSPGFQIFGSFLDNIQLDFLMRATQMDVRSSSVEAPRLVVFNNRGAHITVGSNQSFISTPGFLPTGGSGVGGQAAIGQNPTIGVAFSGQSLAVTPTVSADRKYVTLQLRPNVQRTTLSDRPSLGQTISLTRTEFTMIRTYATVPDQGTILLGGLKLSGETEVEAGVPILSKVPVLKRAFTNRSRVKDEQIVLILVKPTIILPDEQEENAFNGPLSQDSPP